MRKLLLSAIALILTAASYGQIVLNSGNYPASVIGTDSLKTTTAASSFPSLTATADGSWDMSIVIDSMPILYSYHVNATVSPASFADSNLYSLSNYSYQGNAQKAISPTGLLEYGIDVRHTGYSLTAITLGPLDSLIISAQNNLYSSPRSILQFPTALHSGWRSELYFDVSFTISIATVLPAGTPGVVRTYLIEKDSVTGWGKMRVKDLLGNPSDWFNVLQVQSTTKTLDSFFINGVPAAVTILSGLGLTQGQITTTYEQNYYRASEVTPFANVRFSDSTYTTPIKATTHTQRLVNVGVSNVSDNSLVSVYPNPVRGHQVSLSLPAMQGRWNYELADISGRIIVADVINVSSDHTQLVLPPSVAPGVYYLRLSNGGKQVCVRSIDIVK